jgi:hypothetical protein
MPDPFRGKLEHVILRKALGIAADSLFENPGFHSVDSAKWKSSFTFFSGESAMI